jgi:hypothetical protein
VHWELLEVIDDLKPAATRDGRKRQQHAGNAELLYQTRQLVRCMNLEPVDHGATKRWAIVDECPRNEVTATPKSCYEMGAGVAGTIDHNPIARRVSGLKQPTSREAAPDYIDHSEQPERSPDSEGI